MSLESETINKITELLQNPEFTESTKIRIMTFIIGDQQEKLHAKLDKLSSEIDEVKAKMMAESKL